MAMNLCGEGYVMTMNVKFIIHTIIDQIINVLNNKLQQYKKKSILLINIDTIHSLVFFLFVTKEKQCNVMRPNFTHVIYPVDNNNC